MTTSRADPLQGETILPVIEEQLEVGRRKVETGAVRVRKVVHEDTVELIGHHLTVSVETERVPVGRVIAAPMQVRQEGATTIVPIMEERVVLHRELVLVEEIRITRREQVRELPELATVRREAAVVERLDAQTQRWLPEDESSPRPDRHPADAGEGGK